MLNKIKGITFEATLIFLLCSTTTSEAKVGDMAVDFEPSHFRLSFFVCIRTIHDKIIIVHCSCLQVGRNVERNQYQELGLGSLRW